MATTVLGDVIVQLKDGRRIDISGRTPEDAVAHLRALGVTTDDIEHTTHLCRDLRPVQKKAEAVRQ